MLRTNILQQKPKTPKEKPKPSYKFWDKISYLHAHTPSCSLLWLPWKLKQSEHRSRDEYESELGKGCWYEIGGKSDVETNPWRKAVIYQLSTIFHNEEQTIEVRGHWVWEAGEKGWEPKERMTSMSFPLHPCQHSKFFFKQSQLTLKRKNSCQKFGLSRDGSPP